MTSGHLGPDTSFRVRPYALTGGRTRSSADLAIETIVRTNRRGLDPGSRLTLERKAIASRCLEPLSIAEISAHLHLPLGVARVLVGDMVAEGYLDCHSNTAAESGARPDVRLLERVLDGLQAL